MLKHTPCSYHVWLEKRIEAHMLRVAAPRWMSNDASRAAVRACLCVECRALMRILAHTAPTAQEAAIAAD
jgi:hypothetical protein